MEIISYNKSLPMHKDTYFFGYGIDIDKPYDMADKIINQQEEIARLNKIIDELEKTINECSILGEYGSDRMFIEKDYLLNKLNELKEESYVNKE